MDSPPTKPHNFISGGRLLISAGPQHDFNRGRCLIVDGHQSRNSCLLSWGLLTSASKCVDCKDTPERIQKTRLSRGACRYVSHSVGGWCRSNIEPRNQENSSARPRMGHAQPATRHEPPAFPQTTKARVELIRPQCW